MDDDFNTPQALACVFDLVNAANKNIEDADFSSAAAIALREMLDILGIKLTQVASIGAISDSEIQSKINERNQARKNKDFALSDKIRKELEEKGVILEDSKEGTSWRRKI
jgi:cysteinyl-tRNA synthetase